MSEVTIMTECEICGKEPEPKKKRCTRCGQRYDANGVAYVIFCDFYRFYPSPDSESAVTFWVTDGKVQRAPEQFKQLVGETADEAERLMCASGFILKVWPAQVK